MWGKKIGDPASQSGFNIYSGIVKRQEYHAS
jgi:hypothetical protein